MINSLFPKSRQELLRILLLHPQREFYFRELIRLSKTGQGAAQRELASLVKSGIALRRVSGNRVYYRINEGMPIYQELKGLIVKTAGIADLLKNALTHAIPDIKIAFIYGSFAEGSDRTDSDIDLMIIGSIPFKRVIPLLKPVQEAIGRDINATVYTGKEYRQKLAEKQHFCTSLAHGKKLFILGTSNDFEKLAPGRVAGRA
ncbi:MAG: nucleotidyltransferase domain-containing protein [Candidatus Aureabacteria bacterium]|nr:nucleotidyltransferase domain-containing protein [Candidatus Auribacterota bacterium]